MEAIRETNLVYYISSTVSVSPERYFFRKSYYTKPSFILKPTYSYVNIENFNFSVNGQKVKHQPITTEKIISNYYTTSYPTLKLE